MAEPGPPRGEDAVLAMVQTVLSPRPGVLPAARALSRFGEHALGWLVLAGAGAVAQPRRRRAWLTVGAGTLGAHAAAVAVKRVVRRTRPDHPAIAVNAATPSRLSFPSAHVTSTAAAAVLLARVTGRPLLPVALVPPMAVSRLVLGVHYPSDVAAGIGVGAALGAAAAATIGRSQADE